MTDLDPLPHNDPARKKIINLYILFGASLVFSFLPNMSAALFSLLLLLIVMIWAYGIKSKHEAGSLGENHATFIIRTIWIGGFMAIFTLILGSAYMLNTVDSGPLMVCAENAVRNIGVSLDPNSMMRSMQPCIDDFIALNLRDLIVSAIIVMGPVLLYFAVRFVRGLSRAINGYRLADPKSWF